MKNIDPIDIPALQKRAFGAMDLLISGEVDEASAADLASSTLVLISEARHATHDFLSEPPAGTEEGVLESMRASLRLLIEAHRRAVHHL